jgi:hypothetical protein
MHTHALSKAWRPLPLTTANAARRHWKLVQHQRAFGGEDATQSIGHSCLLFEC